MNASNQLLSWNGSNWAQVSLGFTPSNAENAIAAVGETALALLDTGGGIHISTDAGQSWSPISGTASSIAGGGHQMFVRDSGGVSYHVNVAVLQVTNTAAGTWNCPPGAGCPPNSYHTLTATAKFATGGAHGPNGVTATAQGYPINYLTAVATETDPGCDPIYNTGPCQVYYPGTADCSIMGFLSGGGGARSPSRSKLHSRGRVGLGQSTTHATRRNANFR